MKKIAIIIFFTEIIIFQIYLYSHSRDGLTEFLLTVQIFVVCLLLLVLISLVFKNSSVRLCAAIHCLVCPLIFFLCCIVSPDYSKLAQKCFHLNDSDGAEFGIYFNTHDKRFDITKWEPLTDTLATYRSNIYIAGALIERKDRIIFKLNKRFQQNAIKIGGEDLVRKFDLEEVYICNDSIFGLKDSSVLLIKSDVLTSN